MPKSTLSFSFSERLVVNSSSFHRTWNRDRAVWRSSLTGTKMSGAKRSLLDCVESSHLRNPIAKYSVLTPCSSSDVFASYISFSNRL